MQEFKDVEIVFDEEKRQFFVKITFQHPLNAKQIEELNLLRGGSAALRNKVKGLLTQHLATSDQLEDESLMQARARHGRNLRTLQLNELVYQNKHQTNLKQVVFTVRLNNLSKGQL